MHDNENWAQRKRAMVKQHARSSNWIGALQVLTTLAPLALLWWAAVRSLEVSGWLTAFLMFFMALFLVRAFSMMHECGHGSLFRSKRLNRIAGFVFGVVSGMPQYVWAKHHDFHHLTNGNWEKYRGALATLSTEEYDALTPGQQRGYRWARHISLAPIAGFIYLIFNPRFNWLKGNASLVAHLLWGRRERPGMSWREHAAAFTTRYWKTWREYRHQTANNLVLLGLWAVLCASIGASTFFLLYLIPLSIAGGIGIMLFTVQHNFEHSYAADSASWDYDAGAMRGTSFLVLPAWMNWFTADIGYHHVHHLSPAIPNYRLVKCHEENADLFTSIPRLRLSDVPGALECVLWDRAGERIISFAEHERSRAQSAAR